MGTPAGADKTPIVLIHGEADDNRALSPSRASASTKPSKARSATVGIVCLLLEAHGYEA